MTLVTSGQDTDIVVRITSALGPVDTPTMEVLSQRHNDSLSHTQAMDGSYHNGKYCSPTSQACSVPPQFSDPSTVVPPESLADLVDRLLEIFDHDAISVDYVQTLMESYTSKAKEWKTFAKFDKYRYTRNLVHEGNGKFNLMILCWNEAQGSSIHSHANSHCFLKVLDGCAKEEMYDWPSGDIPSKSTDIEIDEGSEEERGMKKSSEQVYSTNACTYINDSIGLHRVVNPSHSDKTVTLHLYSPPFEECQCFDERTCRTTTAKMTFWSKFGKRTPFGRNPEGNASSMEAENN